MQITLNELIKGKATIIKNKTYLSTDKYVEPFIKIMSEYTKDFKIYVKEPDQMTIDGETHTTYNKVLIQAILSKESFDYTEAICFCYSLDSKKPVAKIYKCYYDKKNNNICAFNESWQSIQEILPESTLNYSYVKTLLSLTDDVYTNLNRLNVTDIDKKDLTKYLGEWVDKSLIYEISSDFGKVKLSHNNAIDVYKMLALDRNSERYVIDEMVKLNIYEAFLQTITDDNKDLINKFEKIMLINKIISYDN